MPEAEVPVSISISETALEIYNNSYGTDYVMVPDGYCSLSSDEVVIAAGETSSSLVEISISPFTEEMESSGYKYAIPVAISTDASSGYSTVDGLSFYFILLDQVIITSVPILDYSNIVHPVSEFRQEYELSEWSLEFRINMSSFDINNQAIIGLYPDEIYVRFGDAGKDYNMLQVKTQDTQIESVTRFDAGTWYHIAIVGEPSSLRLYVNGELDSSLALSGSAS